VALLAAAMEVSPDRYLAPRLKEPGKLRATLREEMRTLLVNLSVGQPECGTNGTACQLHQGVRQGWSSRKRS
jgi:hypothetical protein